MASGSGRHALVLLVASLAFLLPCDPLIADRIFLNNGRELEGEITHQSEQSLTIRTDNGIVSVPAPSVTSVVREGAVQNRLNSLGRALLRGDLRQAVIALDGITSSADHRQEIDQLLLRHADAITDAVAGAPPSDVHMLTVHVRNRTGRTPDGILLLQARIAHAGGALLEAARQIQLVSPEFLRADTVARNRAVLILSDVLRRSMDTVEPEVAMELVVAFARLSQDTISTSTATAIYLSNASSRLQLGDYDGALQILRDHVLPISPAIAATEIRTVLESAEKHTSESLFVDIQSRALDTLESAPLSGDLIPLWSRQVRALIRLGQLTFESPDMDTFRCLSLAYQALRAGGPMTTIFNVANEVAVALFLKEKIRFLAIAGLIAESMDAFSGESCKSIEEILHINDMVRRYLRGKYDF